MLCRLNPAHKVRKKGRFPRTTGRKRFIQRYFCRECSRSFSIKTTSLFRNERKSHVNQRVLRMVNIGVSQRQIAIELNIHRSTVAKKARKLAQLARIKNEAKRPDYFLETTGIVFDEMETFEHTRCKPLSITLAVDMKTRKIILARVSSMPAKGHLAKISLKKYGYRKDRRAHALARTLRTAKKCSPNVELIRSDMCPRYPHQVKRIFPNTLHETFKGRRAAITGQGEMKVGGIDPLFALNHTAAMYRDHLKRLSRKTWCTTKQQGRLQDLVDLYTWFHNETIDKGKHRVRI